MLVSTKIHNIVPFSFGLREVRVVVINGEPWGASVDIDSQGTGIQRRTQYIKGATSLNDLAGL
jgi:hypothetical protein